MREVDAVVRDAARDAVGHGVEDDDGVVVLGHDPQLVGPVAEGHVGGVRADREGLLDGERGGIDDDEHVLLGRGDVDLGAIHRHHRHVVAVDGAADGGGVEGTHLLQRRVVEHEQLVRLVADDVGALGEVGRRGGVLAIDGGGAGEEGDQGHEEFSSG